MSSVSLSSFMNLSSSLTSLTLNSCLLRGRLLDRIFRLPNLREHRLADNPQISWFFPMVNSSKALRFLDVSYTIHNSGELPKSIGLLKFLRHLIISGCNFYGPIPTWLGNLTQLTLLNLSANNFAGEIPSSLSNLKALSSLDIRSNNLSGKILSKVLVINVYSLEIFWTHKIATLQEQYPCGLGISRELQIFYLEITASPAKSLHHLYTWRISIFLASKKTTFKVRFRVFLPTSQNSPQFSCHTTSLVVLVNFSLAIHWRF